MKISVRSLFIFGAGIVTSFAVQAQTKVLFLGNSFTYTYNVNTLFAGFCSSAGIPVTVDINAQAGMAVADEQIVGHVNDPTSQSKINSVNWDYIVVQDNQGDYVNSAGIPSVCGQANVALYNQIKANYPCTRIIYFAGWGPAGGVFTGDNASACIDRIHTNMLYLNNNVDGTAPKEPEIVTPIGKAWNASLSQLPGVNLFYADNVHPSLEGSYLAAATIFTTIFKRDPSGLSYTGGVSASTASTMRAIAYSTVTNATNFSATQLSYYTPTISVNGNVLTASGSYSNYQWYFNGSPVGANSNTYTALQSGSYQVEATNSAGCKIRSFVKAVTVTGTGIAEETIKNIELIPVSENVFDLVSDATGQISVFDMQGKQILAIKKEFGSAQIDLNRTSKGLYIVQFTSENKHWTQKVLAR